MKLIPTPFRPTFVTVLALLHLVALAVLSTLAIGASAGQVPALQEGPPQRTPAATARAAIHGIAEAWRTLYNAGRAGDVAALYAEDGYYLSAHVLAHGRAAIQAYWERGIAAGGHVDSITQLEVFHTDSLGYWIGTYQATNAGVTVDGRLLIVVKLVDGRWSIAAHQTVVRDQP